MRERTWFNGVHLAPVHPAGAHTPTLCILALAVVARPPALVSAPFQVFPPMALTIHHLSQPWPPFSPWSLLLLKASGLHSPRPFALLQPRTSSCGVWVRGVPVKRTFSARGAIASFCLLDKRRFSNEKMFCGGKNLGHSLDSRLSVWNPLLSVDRNIDVVPAGLYSFECQPCQALRVRESLFQKRG